MIYRERTDERIISVGAPPAEFAGAAPMEAEDVIERELFGGSLPSLLTVAEAAQLARVSQRSIFRYIERGDLRTYRVGRRRLLISRSGFMRLFHTIPSEAVAAR